MLIFACLLCGILLRSANAFSSCEEYRDSNPYSNANVYRKVGCTSTAPGYFWYITNWRRPYGISGMKYGNLIHCGQATLGILGEMYFWKDEPTNQHQPADYICRNGPSVSSCYPGIVEGSECCCMSHTSDNNPCGVYKIECKQIPGFVSQTTHPTLPPSAPPSATPSQSPTRPPSLPPTHIQFPTNNPSVSPTKIPTYGPSANPSSSPTSSPSFTPLIIVSRSLRTVGLTGSSFVQGQLLQDEELALTCTGCNVSVEDIHVFYGPPGNLHLYRGHSLSFIPKFTGNVFESGVIIFLTEAVPNDASDANTQNLLFTVQVLRNNGAHTLEAQGDFAFSYPDFATRQAPQIDHLEAQNCTLAYPFAINCPTDGLLRSTSGEVLLTNNSGLLTPSQDVLTIWLKNIPSNGISFEVAVTIDDSICDKAVFVGDTKVVNGITLRSITCEYGSGVSGVGGLQTVELDITVINSTSRYTVTSLPVKYFNRSRPVIATVSGCTQSSQYTVTGCARSNTQNRLTVTGHNFGSSDAAVFIGGEQCQLTQHDFDRPHEILYCVFPPGRQTDLRVWAMSSKGATSVSLYSSTQMSYSQCRSGQHQNLTAVSDFNCYTCQPGTFAFGLNTNLCDPCPAGSYSSGGASLCSTCPPGSVAVLPGSSSCTNCPAGTAANDDNSQCDQCPVGTFSYPGSSSCTPCDVGTVAEQPQASACTLCPAGSVASADRTKCSLCSAGTFSNRGDPTCSPCPSGSITQVPGLAECTLCALGEIPFADGSGCDRCVVGTFANETGQVQCTQCNPGYIAPQPRSTFCQPCLPGFAQSLPGQGECDRCDSSSVSRASAATSCARCSVNSAPNINNTRCECNPGFYMTHETVDISTTYLLAMCTACTDGMNCTQGGATWDTLLPLEGYMPLLNTTSTTVAMMPCTNNACVGGHKGFCTTGFTGPLCAECSHGYGRQSANRCEICLPPVTNTIRMIGFFLLAMVLAVCFISYTVRTAELDSSESSIVGKIGFSFLQFNSIALAFNFQFPETVRGFLSIQQLPAQIVNGVMNVDCFVQSSESLTARPVYIKALAYLGLPIFILLICRLTFTRFILCSKPTEHEIDRRRSTQATRSNLNRLMRMSISNIPEESRAAIYLRANNNYFTAVTIILFLIYPSLVQHTFGLFNCRKLGALDTDWYLVEDMGIRCWDTNHTFWALFVGIPLLVLYVIGIPVALFYILFRNRSELSTKQFSDVNRHIAQRYHFLFKGYEPKYYYWEIVIMVRKVAMVSIAVFGGENVQVQSLLATFLIVAALVLHSFACPFISSRMDGLELLSLMSSFCTYFFGQFLFVPSLSFGARIVFSCVIVGVNSVFLCVLLWMFLGNTRQKIIQKLGAMIFKSKDRPNLNVDPTLDGDQVCVESPLMQNQED